MEASYAAMDEALERLSAYGPDLRNGMTSHAPMVAEALCAMGRAQAVQSWLDVYTTGMLPRPRAIERIAPRDWREMLGHLDRTTEWSDAFEEELENAPWREVLDRWVDRLAPGICASAAHGVIRVGHAVRSLAEQETKWRRRELAEGLGYWAANYQELPTAAAAGGEPMPPAAALAQVAIMPRERRTFAGSIVSSLVGLDNFPEFAPAIHLLDVSGPVNTLADDLAEAFACVYLNQAHDFLSAIVFVHSVTSVAALANMLPHLSDRVARKAARFVWQTGCGLYSTFAERSGTMVESEPRLDAADALIDAAVAHGDDHVIKFTEACLTMHERRPSGVFPGAIHSAMKLLPPPTPTPLR